MVAVSVEEVKLQADIVKNQIRKIEEACTKICDELYNINSISVINDETLKREITDIIGRYNNVKIKNMEEYNSALRSMMEWAVDSDEYELMISSEIDKLNSSVEKINRMIALTEKDNNK